jgi:hypothetical protein
LALPHGILNPLMKVLPGHVEHSAMNFRMLGEGDFLDDPDSTEPWPLKQVNESLPLGVRIPV